MKIKEGVWDNSKWVFFGGGRVIFFFPVYIQSKNPNLSVVKISIRGGPMSISLYYKGRD